MHIEYANHAVYQGIEGLLIDVTAVPIVVRVRLTISAYQPQLGGETGLLTLPISDSSTTAQGTAIISCFHVVLSATVARRCWTTRQPYRLQAPQRLE